MANQKFNSIVGSGILAKLLGKSQRQIQNYASEDILSVSNENKNLKFDLYIVIPEYLQYLEEQYKALIKEIDLQYANYSLANAARFMALSESYFSRFFKRRTEMTFTQYLNLVRVEKAIDLLRTTKLNMTKIATACGFGTIRNFNRMFKRITGYSPSTLPATYSQLQIHPTYEVENAVDPTDARSILLKPSEY